MIKKIGEDLIILIFILSPVLLTLHWMFFGY